MPKSICIEMRRGDRKNILKHISDTPISDKEKILKFFKGVEPAGVRCSAVYDHIKDESTHKGIKFYEEGFYIWDDEDIYHFEKYNLQLTDEFLEYAREKIKQSENQAL